MSTSNQVFNVKIAIASWLEKQRLPVQVAGCRDDQQIQQIQQYFTCNKCMQTHVSSFQVQDVSSANVDILA